MKKNTKGYNKPESVRSLLMGGHEWERLFQKIVYDVTPPKEAFLTPEGSPPVRTDYKFRSQNRAIRPALFWNRHSTMDACGIWRYGGKKHVRKTAVLFGGTKTR